MEVVALAMEAIMVGDSVLEDFLVEAEVLVEAEAAEVGNHFNYELKIENGKIEKEYGKAFPLKIVFLLLPILHFTFSID